ncbi:secernin-2 isoform X1 [Frankliniella occidentalis]|uniref:Secernin-2 isoform X1 n=1 Tax=Frankliniella occidentalis TaxID=133901 RepID=A0A6J1SAS4_FRAOC|nr:secernin-2 isoform X1 [Frankliniella occidentalis]XP_052129353.1 secernin-2 isoform X1 [Frankliniella occidentalis]
MADKPYPSSCDTFVVLPPLTSHKGIIFGKNSDRPRDEVQEVVYFQGQEYPPGSKLKCTYIEIEQVSKTFPVILSKPSWMWGAEMGANDQGLCIGNEAVWSFFEKAEDKEEKLLGMDFVRLGLERGASAKEALTIITELLVKHGQGGPCSDTDPDLTYFNSYIIADKEEAWVLETVGKLWVAEKIESGFRNISNALSIGTKIDLKCADLYDVAKSEGLWDGKEDFNFAKIFGKSNDCAEGRKKCGDDMLAELTVGNQFCIENMLKVLRNKDSNICRGRDHSHPTASSQVSVLSPPENPKPSCHWFTGTPDPSISVYKPFVFTPNVQISHLTVSPVFEPDPAKVLPRFQTTVDRSHPLYKFHKDATSESNPNRNEVISKLRSMEEGCIAEVQAFLDKFEPGQPLSEMDELLKDIVETEIKFYK